MCTNPATVTNPDPLLSLSESAEYLGCQIGYLRKEYRANRIAIIRLGSRKIKIRKSELETYIARQSLASVVQQ